MIERAIISGQYVKLPKPITALEAYGSDQLHEHTEIVFRKTRIDGGEVYNGLHRSWIGFTFGDVLNVTDKGDIYPIARQTFFETYVPFEEDGPDVSEPLAS